MLHVVESDEEPGVVESGEEVGVVESCEELELVICAESVVSLCGLVLVDVAELPELSVEPPVEPSVLVVALLPLPL